MATDDEVKSLQDEVSRWFKELEAARQREADFRKNGLRILELYDGTKADETPFNILYSNTETLHPALYSAIPRPVVQRRFKDDDPLGKAAAQAGQRGLEFMLDTNVDQYDTFDDSMKAAALDALLPGRAVTSIKYDNDAPEASEEPGETDVPTPVMPKYETVCTEPRYWDRVLFGYAKRWSQVPWVAYRDYIDKEEATRLFTKEIADKLVYTEGEPEGDGKGEKKAKDEAHQGERKTCCIYQIWDKDGGKMVRYVSEAYKEDYLKVEEDPLGLTGFFNCPKPLQFLQKTHSLVPTALYVLYESQAKELNELTQRIKHVTKAIKARGIYDSELGADLAKLMEASDNELVPADKSSSLAAEKGLQNAIWFMPIQELIVTLGQLYQAREACKQVIYEITGISDILRGATKASETLGAQEIKTQWGTLRLKRAQKEVARYARDLCRLMLELAASKFSEETWAKMTGLPFLLSSKYNELTALAQALQQEVARIQAIQPPPQPQMPGPTPQPPPVPPQVQQLQQIQQQLQAPQWSQVLALLKNDLARAYRIDIETNSTVEPEAAEDQKNIMDVLTAVSQVLQGLGPLVINGSLPFEAAQTILLSIVRRYRFGSEIEDPIKAMQPPKPQDDGKGAELQQAHMQMAQMQAQLQQKDAASQLKDQQTQAEQALSQKKTELDLREMQLKQAEQQFDDQVKVAEAKFAAREQVHAAKASPEAIALRKMELEAERATVQMKEKIHQNTEIEKAKIAAAAQLQIAEISAKAQKEKPEPVGA